MKELEEIQRLHEAADSMAKRIHELRNSIDPDNDLTKVMVMASIKREVERCRALLGEIEAEHLPVETTELKIQDPYRPGRGPSTKLDIRNEKPDYYYRDRVGTKYKPGSDPEVTCWHCKKTFLCDPMDACCRLCHAPFDKTRCDEFGFKPGKEAEG